MSRILSVVALILLVDLSFGEEATPRPAPTSLPHGDTVVAIAYAPDGKTLASASWDKSVRLWDVASAKELRRFTGHEGEIECLVLSPDGKTLATGSWDQVVRLWDIGTGKELKQLGPHAGGILCVAFSPDGKLLATGNQDRNAKQGTLHLWDVAEGKRLRTIAGHSSPVCAVAFSPDGKLLASGSLDKTVRLWEADTAREKAVLQGHTDWVFSLTFSPDGTLLASSSGDRTVRLWDLATNKQRYLYDGHTDKVRTVVFTRDGKTLISGSYDRTLRFWEAASGEQRLLVRGHRGGIRTVALAPDGRSVATGSSDSTVRLAEILDLILDGKPPKDKLTEAELEPLWADLAGKDAARAFAAIGVLAHVPQQALPLLRDRLKQAPAADAKELARLIADLDSARFVVRQKAAKELEKFGELARSALEKALKDDPSVEVSRVCQELLDKFGRPVTATDQLRLLRAVEVLEHIGNEDARQLLQKLSEGVPEAALTREAKAALSRFSPAPTP